MPTTTLGHASHQRVPLSLIASAVLTLAGLASSIGVIHTVRKDLAEQRSAMDALTAPTKPAVPTLKQSEWIPLR